MSEPREHPSGVLFQHPRSLLVGEPHLVDVGQGVVVVATGGRVSTAHGADHHEPRGECLHEGRGVRTQITEVGSTSPTADFTAKQALRTAAFWQISFGHGLAVMLISALMVHLIPHLTGQLGYSLAFAGLVVALMTSMQLLGMVFGGVLGDRFSKRAIVVTAMIMHAAAALLLTVAVTPLLVVVFAVIHGIAWGARGPLQQAWRADLFGSTSFGAIMGFSSIVVMLGAAGGPLLAGILFDRLGDYTATLRLLAVLAVVGSMLFFFVRRPSEPAAAVTMSHQREVPVPTAPLTPVRLRAWDRATSVGKSPIGHVLGRSAPWSHRQAMTASGAVSRRDRAAQSLREPAA